MHGRTWPCRPKMNLGSNDRTLVSVVFLIPFKRLFGSPTESSRVHCEDANQHGHDTKQIRIVEFTGVLLSESLTLSTKQ